MIPFQIDKGVDFYGNILANLKDPLLEKVNKQWKSYNLSLIDLKVHIT